MHQFRRFLAISALFGCATATERPAKAQTATVERAGSAPAHRPLHVMVEPEQAPEWVLICEGEDRCEGVQTLNPLMHPAFYVVHDWTEAWFEDSSGTRRATLRPGTVRTVKTTEGGSKKSYRATHVRYGAPPEDAFDGVNTYVLVVANTEMERSARIKIFYMHNVPRL